jgi:hypothetical protein
MRSKPKVSTVVMLLLLLSVGLLLMSPTPLTARDITRLATGWRRPLFNECLVATVKRNNSGKNIVGATFTSISVDVTGNPCPARLPTQKATSLKV